MLDGSGILMEAVFNYEDSIMKDERKTKAQLIEEIRELLG